MTELSGKVAIITGAAGGIGLACARLFAAAGAHVVLCDINETSAREAAAALSRANQSADALGLDITCAVAVDGLFRRVADRCSRIDFLINNAGLLRSSSLEEIRETEWDQVLAVNLKGAFLCAQAVAPYMKIRNSGRIVNIASLAGKATSTLGGAHYTAAKAGMLGLTRHLARELAPYAISVNAVCPGVVATPMTEAAMDPARRRKVLAAIPFGRFANPDEVAELVLFLASDRSRYITGAAVDIHGGELIIQ